MFHRTKFPLALFAAISAGLVLAAQGSAAAPERPVQLAQFADPSMPLPPKQLKRGRIRDAKPEIPPFALPTTPLTAPSTGPTGLPGGSEFPPYEKELLRLAEILGAVHYLRGLCGGEDGNLWRDRMEQLLDVEAAKDAWRARLIGSFNDGYNGFERTYRTCTPAAARASELYLAEGQQLTGAIKAKYAN